LVESGLNDKIIFNYVNNVKEAHLTAINYEKFESVGGRKPKSRGFNTEIGFIETRPSLPPLFPEEKEEVKAGTPDQQPKSFWAQYVIYNLN
jgi:hypothetical protein